MRFNDLVHIIKETDSALKQKALMVINQSLTIRNWLTGFYIVEFEQNGEDKAEYGTNLIHQLSKGLKPFKLKAFSDRDLRRYRQFYLAYPIIWQSLTAKSNFEPIWQSLTAKFKNSNNKNIDNRQSLTGDFNLSFTDEKYKLQEDYIGVEPEILINKISFTHFVELMSIDNPFKRAFYEIECIKGNWSVRELQR